MSNVWTCLEVASAHTLDAVFLAFVCVHPCASAFACLQLRAFGGRGLETIDQVPTVFLNLEKLPTWNKDWQERDFGGRGLETIDQVPTVFLNLEKLPTWNKDWQERDSRPHKTAWTVAEEFCCMHLHSSTCVCVSVHRKLKVWTRQDTKGSQTRLFFKDL